VIGQKYLKGMIVNMDEILKLGINDMKGLTYDCSCGRSHSVDLNRVVIGRGIEGEITGMSSDFRKGTLFLLADNNTYAAYGEKVFKLLDEQGFKLKVHVFNTSHALVPDEKAVGRILLELEKGTSLIIAVGTGTINDLARFVSCRLNIPYIIIATAPSMDGFAATLSMLIIENRKTTHQGWYAHAIAADINVLREAPMTMIHAGFGDIIGKLTALADWELSHKLTGEYYCETTVKLVEHAVKKCIDSVRGIALRDENAVKYLMEALTLTGVAMGLVGVSRPASGSEHLIAHYWELDCIARGVDHPLHGNCVAVGAVVTATIYELMSSVLPVAVNVPKPEYISGLLKEAGSHDNPASLGIDKDLFKQSILHAFKMRPRFTVMRHASEKGMLEDIAEKLTKKFYGA